MISFSDILKYELKNTSAKKLQKQTGIPTPLFKKLKRGKEIKFSEKSIKKISENYIKKSVDKLHKKGMSEREAIHYVENYNSSEVTIIEKNAEYVAIEIYKHKLRFYEQAVKEGRKIGDDGKPLIKPLLKHIKDGLKKSSKTHEDFLSLIVGYGKRSR